ncbi:TrmB family transcriptional regulator sugar-binding domain-containing protein [Methanococcus voltae]|uniref:Transcription regulator TrmB C-terminal domain-containing protein n=1 Tax=Methanococcus voltae (strain ATCC BAA-1334 / A3) TaxID=456320 RepID=D7DRV3_METV3|nr:TrmB family transcriptional regulator sugar-binding domain-containing protein [Methanococcus voltae]MCS3901388.1 hypothetical protein [Methanococcus voltae]
MKLKIGILEILVILSIVITAGVLGYNFLGSNTTKYDYSGEEMYKCAWVSENILKKGFILNAEVDGEWTADKSPFKDTVRIIGASGGTLTVIYGDKEYEMGGRLASKEDVAIKYIKLVPAGNSMITYRLNSVQASSYADLKSKIEQETAITGLTPEYIIIEGSIASDGNTLLPTTQQEIRNVFKYEKLMPTFSILINGTTMMGEFEITHFESFDEILHPNNVLTSDLKVSVVYSETEAEITEKIGEDVKLKISSWK